MKSSEEIKDLIVREIDSDGNLLKKLSAQFLSETNPVLKKALETQISLTSYGMARLQSVLKEIE